MLLLRAVNKTFSFSLLFLFISMPNFYCCTIHNIFLGGKHFGTEYFSGVLGIFGVKFGYFRKETLIVLNQKTYKSPTLESESNKIVAKKLPSYLM